ncbi:MULTISPECIES: phage portal protein [unclassified Yoonia]|uniref:phage portal protein n=1 Tax=unclassified Yoonia TaxID=2629118 RepID=UPI002AFF7FE3|nr:MULTISPECIES: phage portal protein [unclassified Yoonia]
MKRSLIDRAVGIFSPRAELERLKARAAVNLVRSYDSARQKKRDGGWVAQGSSANAEIGPALARLRNSSRDMVRNNAYAARVIDIVVAHDIGAGIVARPRTGKKTTDKRLAEAWKAWAETTECDAEGQLDIYGLQSLIRRTVAESGECIVRLRYRRAEDGLTVPLQLQVLEPDHLDHLKHETLPGGGRIVFGVEFDALGRRVAFWLHRDHPGDTLTRLGAAFSSSVRVPAEEVLHIYRKQRAGQVRGVPELSAVMTKLQDLGEYHEAALVRAKMEAAIALVVTREDPGDDSRPLAPVDEDEDGNRIEKLYPGMISYLDPGENITTINPTPSAGHEAFSRAALHSIGVGAGVTYDQISGDLSGANYSSLRAGKIEFRRQVEQRQWQMLIPMLCAPIWKAFVKAGNIAGSWPIQSANAEFTPPAHEQIDPRKDGAAMLEAVRAGFMTWPQAVSSMGYDPDTQLDEIAEWARKVEDAKVTLDSDGRVSKSGGMNAFLVNED